MNSTLRVALVSPEVWQEVSQKAFGKLSPRESGLGKGLLSTLHNRHVGITPALAAELAVGLLDPNRLPERGVWSMARDRLAEEFSTGKVGRRTLGLVFKAHPTYCILKLALPLVESACAGIGSNYLFCEEPTSPFVSLARYREYETALSQGLSALVGGTQPQLELFWKDRALALARFSKKSRQFRGNDGVIPHVEPTALSLFLRLKPNQPEIRQGRRRARRLSRSPVHRDVRHRREGGLQGIHLTRKIEDMDSILLSEMANPEIILKDRMLNTGFFALQRPPKREKKRDVLLAALAPIPPRQRLVADFVKACWFEALLHLSIPLRQGEMAKSEFRWSEGPLFGPVRHCGFSLQDMNASVDRLEPQMTEGYREAFTTRLGWLPQFLDTLGQTNLTQADSGAEDDDLSRLKSWIRQTWTGQRVAVAQPGPLDRPSASRPVPNSLKDYSHVHLMLFLPANMQRQFRGLSLFDFLAGLGLGGPGQSVSLTWLPQTVSANPQWGFESQHHRVPLFPRKDASMRARDVAGKLVQTWVDCWQKEIWGV